MIRRWHLPYVDALASRQRDAIRLVVIHCTELPDLAMAREYGERIMHVESATGNSGHFYIDRDGSLCEFVPIDRIAHHTRGYNPQSIGIELINSGRYPHWFDSRHQQMTEPYPEAQIDALRRLLSILRDELPELATIAGHEDLDTTLVDASDDAHLRVHRKRDPGPMFPWPEILRELPWQRIGKAN